MIWKAKLSRLASGPLTVVSVFLLASGGIRALEGGSEAFARETNQPKIAVAELPPTPLIADAVGGREILDPLLNELAEREKDLMRRETEFEARMVSLEEAEARISLHIAQLESAEAQLSETLTMAETAASEDVAKLTAVFEKMKSKEAAKLFEEMDPNFAAGFLAEMNPEVAAALLAGLQPETAYALSVILAGRNAGAPKK